MVVREWQVFTKLFLCSGSSANGWKVQTTVFCGFEPFTVDGFEVRLAYRYSGRRITNRQKFVDIYCL